MTRDEPGKHEHPEDAIRNSLRVVQVEAHLAQLYMIEHVRSNQEPDDCNSLAKICRNSP